MKPAPTSTQVIQRDRHAEYFLTLALVGANVEKVALEIRHLQRTEVWEAEEMFAAGQKGSSAMPHKRNPISRKTSAAWPGCSGATPWRPWKTWPCGTNGTSATPRWSG